MKEDLAAAYKLERLLERHLDEILRLVLVLILRVEANLGTILFPHFVSLAQALILDA